MSERLTHSDVFGGILTNSEINHFGGAHTGTEVAYCGEPIDKLFEIENMCYDASGNEIISLSRLRELAEADREGRIEIKEKENKHDVRVCSNCQSIVHYDPYFKRYLCRTCGLESYLPQSAKEMMEAERALAEKGDAT